MTIHLVRHPSAPLRATWCGEAATRRHTPALRSALAQERARLGARTIGLTRYKDPIVALGAFDCPWCRSAVETEHARLSAILVPPNDNAPHHVAVPL